MKNKVLISALAVSTLVVGCTPIVIGGAATAAYIGVQDRGAQQAVLDTSIKTGIKDKLFQKNYKYLSDVGVHVLEGNVLLTGVVTEPAASKGVQQVAQSYKGVRAVYNNLMVGQEYTTAEQTRDSWIGTQVRTRLVGARDVYSVNYITDTVRGNVYILGIAGSLGEKERVLHVARTTRGVVKVHDFIRIQASGVAE